ncbi:conserved membrane hypothetical protein [Verrucomicrobia bacterium]|nr:conserved membrane hypothetical protein [Verrucomicrobiota bacterium]
MTDFISSLGRPDVAGSLDGRTVLFMVILAFTIGMFIGQIYMWTHEALSYSRTYVGALAILPAIVAMLMAAMSGVLMLVFGLLGVSGMVRFRNVLKDTRDTTFILWVIMEGLAVGALRFSTALIAAAGIGACLLLLRLMSFGTRSRYDAVLSLRLTGDIPARMAAVRGILKRHAIKLNLASETRSTPDGTDLTYRLLLRDPSRSSELQSELTSAEGFQNVSVYMHEDEAEI